jgi:tetratricopeptide (TPR) repeat protein
MRDRLEHAETAQQAMRAMCLLRQAAIFRPAVKVLAATVSGVYAPATTPEDLEPEIAWLVDNAFLERSGGRIWPTHDVYVTRDFFGYYVEGSPTLDAHLNRLGEIFELAKLANELQSLGISFLSKQDYVAGLRWLQAAAIFTTNDARLYVNIAVAYSGQGQHENAVANLRQAAAIRPDFAETYSRLGYALNSLDLRSEAIEAWKQAVRLGSNDANLRYNLGVLLTWAGQHQEAAAQFREGLRLQPETPDAQYNLGINLLRLNLLQEAVACFREAVRMQPTEHRFHYELAGALAQDRQVQEAIAEYRATLQLKPEMVAAHHNLGNLLYTAGSVDEAFEEWRQEAALDPRAPDPRFNMALVLADRGEIDQAIKLFQEVITLKPDMARAYINLGRLWKARGRDAESIQSLRGGVREEPGNYGYRLLLADGLTSAEQYDEAIHEYRESIRLKESPAGHYNLALALRSVGRYKEALAEFSEAARLDPNDAEAHYELCVSHHGNGQLDLALDECHKAIVLKPDIEIERGVYNYGFLLICAGRVMEAIAEFRRILAVRADAPEANTGLGLALSGAHKDEEALPFHERAVRLKPDSGAIHHCYGLTLKALGRQEEAEREFAEARRLGYDSHTSQTKTTDAAAGAIRSAPGP